MTNSFYTQPASPMQGLQFFGQQLGKRRDYQRGLAKENQEQQKRQKAYNLMKTGTWEQIEEFITTTPGAQKIFDEAISFKSESTKRDYLETARKIYLEGAEPVQALSERAQKVMQEGGDATETIEAAGQAIQDPNKGKEWAMRVFQVYEPATYKQIMDIDAGPTVGAQEILEDGTIIQSTSKGPRVYDKYQKEVKGQAAADAIELARAQKVSNARLAAGEKKRATLEAEKELKGEVEAGVISQKEAAKISNKAHERLEGINQNIANLNEGIRLLREEGANTGVVDKYLPSIRKSSIRMDNLQGRLGLDILRNTTFGALSASELKFALDTALPKGLQPLELADWLEEKRDAQEKLADYIESAAIYLGTAGNTVAGWIKKKKAEREAAEVKQKETITPKYREGQTATVNGKPLIFSGGAWRDR